MLIEEPRLRTETEQWSDGKIVIYTWWSGTDWREQYKHIRIWKEEGGLPRHPFVMKHEIEALRGEEDMNRTVMRTWSNEEIEKDFQAWMREVEHNPRFLYAVEAMHILYTGARFGCDCDCNGLLSRSPRYYTLYNCHELADEYRKRHEGAIAMYALDKQMLGITL